MTNSLYLQIFPLTDAYEKHPFIMIKPPYTLHYINEST